MTVLFMIFSGFWFWADAPMVGAVCFVFALICYEAETS